MTGYIKYFVIYLIPLSFLYAGGGFRSELVYTGSLLTDYPGVSYNGTLLWIPEIDFSFSGRVNLDALVSQRFSAAWAWDRDKYPDAEGDFYRAWIRLSGSSWDLRGGLQKITFGPAQLFRALMWFDELNPSDPLGLTSGVWGMRSRIFFQNNTNIWGWVLYGNKGLSGNEFYPTKDESFEFGGRLQFPVALGEWGISMHGRKTQEPNNPVLHSQAFSLNTPALSNNGQEYRLGFDGQWDIVAGVWFESVITHSDINVNFPWKHANVVGLDYTFPWGSGLYVLAEYGVINVFDEKFINSQSTETAGMMINYPLTFFSSLSGILMWIRNTDLLTTVLSYQHTSGNFTLHLQFFQLLKTSGGKASDISGVAFDTQIKGMISWHFSSDSW